jgi:hypothetical protein
MQSNQHYFPKNSNSVPFETLEGFISVLYPLETLAEKWPPTRSINSAHTCHSRHFQLHKIIMTILFRDYFTIDSKIHLRLSSQIGYEISSFVKPSYGQTLTTAVKMMVVRYRFSHNPRSPRLSVTHGSAMCLIHYPSASIETKH